MGNCGGKKPPKVNGPKTVGSNGEILKSLVVENFDKPVRDNRGKAAAASKAKLEDFGSDDEGDKSSKPGKGKPAGKAPKGAPPVLPPPASKLDKAKSVGPSKAEIAAQ